MAREMSHRKMLKRRLHLRFSVSAKLILFQYYYDLFVDGLALLTVRELVNKFISTISNSISEINGTKDKILWLSIRLSTIYDIIT